VGAGFCAVTMTVVDTSLSEIVKKINSGFLAREQTSDVVLKSIRIIFYNLLYNRKLKLSKTDLCLLNSHRSLLYAIADGVELVTNWNENRSVIAEISKIGLIGGAYGSSF
jgi:hypothetical protein